MIAKTTLIPRTGRLSDNVYVNETAKKLGLIECKTMVTTFILSVLLDRVNTIGDLSHIYKSKVTCHSVSSSGPRHESTYGVGFCVS